MERAVCVRSSDCAAFIARMSFSSATLAWSRELHRCWRWRTSSISADSVSWWISSRGVGLQPYCSQYTRGIGGGEGDLP